MKFRAFYRKWLIGFACFLLGTATAVNAQAPSPSSSLARLDGLQIGTGSAVTIVMLHGDEGNGGDPTANYAFGAEIARRLPDATVHMLLRPGYEDPWGRKSPGENYGRRDQYTMENARLIAENLRRIKGDRPLIAVGHSGGAAQLALALSLDKDVVDEAILVSCPCDLPLWQSLNPQWPQDILVRSTSPTHVSPNVKGQITIVVGDGDQVTPTQLSQSYAQHLANKDVPYQIVIVRDGDHRGNRALSQAWLTAIFAARQRLVE